MWSHYDTLILVTGIIVMLIGIIPFPGVRATTRIWSAVIGAGIIVLSIITGHMYFVVYPFYVYIAPFAAAAYGGAIAVDGRKRAQREADPDALPGTFADGLQSHVVTPPPGAEPVDLEPLAAAPVDAEATAPEPVDLDATRPAPPAVVEPEPDPELELARAALDRPDLSPTSVADIAYSHASLRSAAALHPAAYPALVDWIHGVGSD